MVVHKTWRVDIGMVVHMWKGLGIFLENYEKLAATHTQGTAHTAYIHKVHSIPTYMNNHVHSALQ